MSRYAGAFKGALDQWRIVNRIGEYEILEGSGPDGGDWMARSASDRESFSSRSAAESYARKESDRS